MIYQWFLRLMDLLGFEIYEAYRCEACGRDFETLTQVKYHVSIDHPEATFGGVR